MEHQLVSSLHARCPSLSSSACRVCCVGRPILYRTVCDRTHSYRENQTERERVERRRDARRSTQTSLLSSVHKSCTRRGVDVAPSTVPSRSPYAVPRACPAGPPRYRTDPRPRGVAEPPLPSLVDPGPRVVAPVCPRPDPCGPPCASRVWPLCAGVLRFVCNERVPVGPARQWVVSPHF
jgi:hypothetical protein